MSRREAYGKRPSGTWQPTERQRQVLDALAEGKTNAEIAVRLGITVDGAKWHVGELLAQAGVSDRQALAAWWREQSRRRAPAWLPLALGLLKPALAIAVLIAVAAGGVALFAGGEAERSPAFASYTPVVAPTATPWPEEAVEALAEQDEPPANCEPPEQQDLRIVSAGELRAQGLVDLGRVVFVGHCPLYVANRADRAVAWLGGGGYVKADFSRGRGAGACCRYGMFYYGDQEYSLALYAANLVDGQFRGLAGCCRDLVKVERALDQGAYLMLDLREWVESSPGPISVGLEHRAYLSSDGRLFLDQRPLAGSIATNWLTGEAIDLTGLQQIGTLPLINGGAIRNDCYLPEGICGVQYDNGPAITAPLSGVLRCVKNGPRDGFELDAGSLKLRLTNMSGYDFQPADCTERNVSTGDTLPGATFFGISAFAADGSPLSLVITRDGRLYVGRVDLKLNCPCEPRS